MKVIRTSLIIISIFMTTKLFSITPEELSNIDITKDYSSKTVSELRLIKSMIYARHGYLFMRSELRNYFVTNYKWYEELIYKNQELKDKGKPVPPLILLKTEKEFIDKIDKMIEEQCAANYFQKDSVTHPKVNNVYNYFEKNGLTGPLKQHLSEYGFVIQKDSLEQLFHGYDLNQYSGIPNFVTTDLYLQLLHIYFSYTIKILEKDKLIGLVTELSDNLYRQSLKYLTEATDKDIKEMARFNVCFYAVAYTLISGKQLNLPQGLNDTYVAELANISNTKNIKSPLFNSGFPYNLFIPRGHYSRTEEQKRYFKAMMWLQVAPYCLSDKNLLRYACFNAFMLNYAKDATHKPLKELYFSIYKPIAYLIGESDNLSVMDICDIYNKYGIKSVEELTQKKTLNLIEQELWKTVNTKDKIKPKLKLDCQPKINFMPQRYLVDNDILQQFADTTRDAPKAFPKALEIFSVLGVNTATDLLYNFYKENQLWKPYDSVMKQQSASFKTFNNWDVTLYNKWLQCLLKLNKPDKRYPYFMQNRGWKLKNLNTSLASWAELKHDAILYGEQPMVAEMGDGGDELPPPVTVGYVEPNLEFWNTAKEMLAKNDSFLTLYNLKSEELTDKTQKISEILNFFITVSQKELNKQNLSNNEYKKIETISGEFDYLSLHMLNPFVNYSYWYEVTGPDKTIALIADVYTRNVPFCSKNAILHEATGKGNTIFVIVEIEGKLYLTKGAVFSYYEFSYPERLTDERWLEMVGKEQIKPVEWMNELMIQ